MKTTTFVGILVIVSLAAGNLWHGHELNSAKKQLATYERAYLDRWQEPIQDAIKAPTEPPDGWQILTRTIDGKKVYTWRNRDGFTSIFEEETRQEAVDNAWSYLKYKENESQPWQEEKQ